MIEFLFKSLVCIILTVVALLPDLLEPALPLRPPVQGVVVDHLHHVGGAVGGHVVVVRLVDGVSLLLHHRGPAADTAAPGDLLEWF